MTDPERGTAPEYDVVIAGASLAGCAAAILLARRGVRVALLERRSDPAAYKVLCTHSIHAAAYPVLAELGLAAALEEAGAVRNTSYWYTRWGWIEPRPGPGGAELPYAYNVRRSTLDPLIRSRAAATEGVDLLLGHRVTGLLRDGAGRISGVSAGTPDGDVEIRARLVVGADGKDSAVAKLAGVAERRHENRRFGYLAQYRDLPLKGGVGRTWFLEPDMAYAFPNEDGITVLALVLDRRTRLAAFREDLEGSFDAFLRALPEAPPIDSAERVSKIIGMIDHPLITRAPTAPGLALIGDAALTGDPLWGVGCGWAFQSAAWLAESTAPALLSRTDAGPAPLDRALARYARTHRRQLRPHQQIAVEFASSRPFNAMERLMFSAAVRDPWSARHMHRFAMRLIGPLGFLNPVAVARAAYINLTHRAGRTPEPVGVTGAR
ncbi:NAD(P)/FAD-dependent oxidoreductase [Streptomyces sp. NPDC090025]|uniref:NAD(P)/FAD-dependent oxidoreductase n=1 Tax=Streptomyces sp. NPDC090025 TaxID=3365922 RepID=UPI00383852BF